MSAGTSDASWDLVLSRDGTVLAAGGATPSPWVGRRLDECSDASAGVKQAGHVLLQRATGSSQPPTAASVPIGAHETLHVTVVDAMPLRRAPSDVRALLSSALESLQRQARARDVLLDIDVSPDVPRLVSLDSDKIAWALSALVGNALRYVKHGSQCVPGGSIAVGASYDPATSQLTIEVRDDGPGIPDDRLSHIFTPEAGKRRVGLGLVMVRDIVIAHGGRVEIESATASGYGTTVRMVVPVS